VKTPAEMHELIRMIREDLEADVDTFEGQPFTGRAVSVWFGQMAAAVSALATIVDQLIPGNMVGMIPDDTPPQVQAVRDADDDLWVRDELGRWCFRGKQDECPGSHEHKSWDYLYDCYKPLTEVGQGRTWS
jgi:hypothetical protein